MRRAERQVSDIQRSLKNGRTKPGSKPREALADIKREIVCKLGTPLERPVETPQIGRQVRVKSLGKVGTVKTVLDSTRVEVSAGNLTIRADTEDLILLGHSPAEKSPSRSEGRGIRIPSASPRWEVNVIGLRVDDAFPIVEKALDEALLTGLASLNIVHGKGTGRLKKGLRERLTGHPLVKGFRSGDIRQGGEGVTVVDILSE
jgi:DNA mismatch repair protein MutS2